MTLAHSSHRLWLGALDAIGLVVSPPALTEAQLIPDRNVADLQQAAHRTLHAHDDQPVALLDWVAFATQVLAWAPGSFAGAPGGPPVPSALCVPVPDYPHDTLRAQYAFVLSDARRAQYQAALRHRAAHDALPVAELAVMLVDRGVDLDAPLVSPDGRTWPASPQHRLERLLRESGVPAGLLCNGHQLRLVSAPTGESSGALTWPVAALPRVDGRPLLAALHMLLRHSTVAASHVDQRLTAVLRHSRNYQNEVSTQLARQVREALHELVGGWQAATDPRRDDRPWLSNVPLDALYEGLLAALLRLVFLLYAEERGMLPDSAMYVQHYSVAGLFDQLRQDHASYPDTMDERFGAWARLCMVFRLVHDGSQVPALQMPARQGRLFDPDSWPFLEGRQTARQAHDEGPLRLPRLSDGVLYRVLDRLLLLGEDSGPRERLAYRALDVEHLGSVYEGLTGYGLARTEAPTLRLGDHLVPLPDLLAAKSPDRAKRLDAALGRPAPKAVKDALTAAADVDDLRPRLAARRVAARVLPTGTLTVQLTDGRRASGSHYTPRALTGPVVTHALRPHLDRLGPTPTPAQLLQLRICDPAMGSGAFLVEATRQLGALLEASWIHHGLPAEVANETDRLVAARRLVATRCIYGVDLNPFAVELAKLSLWLVTLSRAHAFTFVDHALRHGDSLVGLTERQILEAVEGTRGMQPGLLAGTVRTTIQRAIGLRARAIADPFVDKTRARRQTLDEATNALADVQLVGDALVAASFATAHKVKAFAVGAAQAAETLWNPGADEDARAHARQDLWHRAHWLRTLPRPVPPLHWPLAFPEVYDRPGPGFDMIVGNPPFAGKNTLINSTADGYLDWLQHAHPGAHGNADLVAHFFRRAYDQLRPGGTFGLIATNTIAQGDTRTTGLTALLERGAVIYHASASANWEGAAAVHTRWVHVWRRDNHPPPASHLAGTPVARISAFLLPGAVDREPAPLAANDGQCFVGAYVLGMGFTFDDTDKKGQANPLQSMHALIARDPHNAQRIFPYLGGEELNTHPQQRHHRYVINFGQMTLEEAAAWPDLLAIVEEKVKPQRDQQKREIRARYWWRFGEATPALFAAMEGKARVLGISLVSTQFCLAWLPASIVPSHKLGVFVVESDAAYATLQSRVHEVWARMFASTMKDDLNYSPSTCFQNFPFPPNWEANAALHAIGQEYDAHRAHVMTLHNEGLTKTYNRLHSPTERSAAIAHLRTLHQQLDHAVLSAYGWDDLQPTPQFLTPDGEPWDTLDDHARAALKPRDIRLRYAPADEATLLARLLALHAERYAAETQAGLHAKRAAGRCDEDEEDGAAGAGGGRGQRRRGGRQGVLL